MAVVEEKRVSRQAREMEDLMLSFMLIMTLMAAVEVNISIYYLLFCWNPDFWHWLWPRNSDSKALSSWVDWQRIDIWSWNYNQSIEHNESFPKRHASPSYDFYKLRWEGLGEFRGNSNAWHWMMVKWRGMELLQRIYRILHWIGFQMSHYSFSNDYYKPRYQRRRDFG